uniref:Putative reverse transcriptase domain-containing protein n=1 Tax=Tanacetum cinerariifolium TaxID=118510 RepID=A0A699GI52_TANCI|nr:putative reverse transcriptase domain-containing protein [Tanacetum cinerariifolium]
MPSISFSKPPLVAEIDSVFDCIKSFSKGTSCRKDGLRAQHILDALCGEGSANAIDLLKVITSVINLWLAGRCSPILAEFVASAPHTPLLKLNNGIRFIAVGTIWRHLGFKVSMKGVGKEMSKYLSDFQFGVRVSGGAEAVLHSVNSCKLLLHAWYLNDGIVIGDSEEVARLLDIIKASGPCLGLELNIKKTEICWPSCNGTKLREGLFLVDIQRPSSGVKLLEGGGDFDTTFASIPTATNSSCHTTVDPPSPTSSPRDHRGYHQLHDTITTYGSPQQPTPINLRRPPPLPATTPPTTTTTHLLRRCPAASRTKRLRLV